MDVSVEKIFILFLLLLKGHVPYYVSLPQYYELETWKLDSLLVIVCTSHFKLIYYFGAGRTAQLSQPALVS